MLKQTIKLNCGLDMPRLALGTWHVEDDAASHAVKNAIQLGYRHIDTAHTYDNEHGVGEGIRASGIARENIFVASKVAAEHKSYNKTLESIDHSLRALGLDYLDLMTIHTPQPFSLIGQTEDRFFDENIQAYRALEDACAAGKVRAIGVANFTIEDLQNILDNCSIVPAVNQMLAHVSCVPFSLMDFCVEHGIQPEAHSPIARGEIDRISGVASMAAKYGATVAQLCIRYVIQLGMVALPKSVNPEHMRQNATLDFTISRADMDILSATSQGYDAHRCTSYLFGSLLFE